MARVARLGAMAQRWMITGSFIIFVVIATAPGSASPIIETRLISESGSNNSDLASAAAREWAEYGQCLEQFFDRNPENVAASNLSRWYIEKIAQLKHQQPEKYTHDGQSAHFARFYANARNFDCISSTHCIEKPSCPDVARSVEIQARKKNLTMSPEEHMVQTRNTLWALEQMVNINEVFSRQYVCVAPRISLYD